MFPESQKVQSYTGVHQAQHYMCNNGLLWPSILLVVSRICETKYLGDFDFSDVFSVKQKARSVSKDKYQNASRVKAILLKAVCWTLVTFCSRSVSDIDNYLFMKSEYIFVGDFKTNKKIQENRGFLEKAFSGYR